jgi:hypothetical protein
MIFSIKDQKINHKNRIDGTQNNIIEVKIIAISRERE